jgi:hypothetical protein
MKLFQSFSLFFAGAATCAFVGFVQSHWANWSPIKALPDFGYPVAPLEYDSPVILDGSFEDRFRDEANLINLRCPEIFNPKGLKIENKKDFSSDVQDARQDVYRCQHIVLATRHFPCWTRDRPSSVTPDDPRWCTWSQAYQTYGGSMP